MTRDSWSVECIGSFALVSLWEVTGLGGPSSAMLGRWGGSVLGNDAVIVARELRDRGLNVRCRLLDPTNADVSLVASVLGPEIVVAIGGRRGECTRSLCLEDTAGGRTWIFSRLPEPHGELGDIRADVVYVDYYPEFVQFLNHHFAHLESSRAVIVVNLSGIAAFAEVPQLAVRPSVLQASLPGDLTLDEAAMSALRLVEATGAHKVFVTMGARGAVLAIGRETWHSEAPVKRGGSILGAGAMFSAQVIIGLSDGLDGELLLKWSVSRTALRLMSIGTCDEIHRS